MELKVVDEVVSIPGKGRIGGLKETSRCAMSAKRKLVQQLVRGVVVVPRVKQLNAGKAAVDLDKCPTHEF